MRHVMGIDAGGTKTVGLLADETDKIIAQIMDSHEYLEYPTKRLAVT